MAQNIISDDANLPKVKKSKKVDNEYPRGIKKIASFSGVARIMECTGKCGAFDDIVNIYVFPDGAKTDEYNTEDNKIIDKYIGESSISKANVSEKDLTYWGKNWTGEKTVPRRKIASKSVKRRIKKHN